MNIMAHEIKVSENVPCNVRVTWTPIKRGGLSRNTVSPDSISVPAHLVVVDPEVGLLAPEVPLYDRPALKPYK